MENEISNEVAIRALVKTNIETFAQTFSERHVSDIDNENGTINMKIHNVFIAVLGKEVQYYTSLVRSLDSSLGNMLETLAIGIASLFYTVHQRVEGPLYPEQTSKIAELLESYKNSNNPRKPSVEDYLLLRDIQTTTIVKNKVHASDYYLKDEVTNTHYLIELKIGGDLDNKKARSEKEALFEQYSILSNTLPREVEIKSYFATAYNRFGENKPWKQGRVKQFFADEELLIGKDFWNFVCKDDQGYNIVLDEYKKNSDLIVRSLDKIKEAYLG